MKDWQFIVLVALLSMLTAAISGVGRTITLQASLSRCFDLATQGIECAEVKKQREADNG